MKDITVNRFRAARGRKLAAKITALSQRLGRPVRILDVGGRPDYWENVGLDGIGEIVLQNLEAGELSREASAGPFRTEIGDARALDGVGDGAYDLVHSNSVIEHVGLWPDMAAMAAEVRRAGVEGWVQTPAWEFPVEPHFRLPFLHWFAQPARRSLLRLSPHYGRQSPAERRNHVDRINLLSHAEMQALFPSSEIWIERVALLPKSYVAIW
ncbi:MAG: methyltransferase domain-containing protein [Pseudomonadota bacterium]